jgi:flagellar basal-body rod protein FlgB
MDRAPTRFASLMLDRTEPGHIGAVDGGSGRFAMSRPGGYEIRPTGNAVSLEDEMIKVAANQMDYQAATTLYTRSIALIKTALGKGG